MHRIKAVDVKKNVHKDDDGKLLFEVLDIQLTDDADNKTSISAFLNKEKDGGYNINLIWFYKARTGSHELVRAFFLPVISSHAVNSEQC